MIAADEAPETRVATAPEQVGAAGGKSKGKGKGPIAPALPNPAKGKGKGALQRSQTAPVGLEVGGSAPKGPDVDCSKVPPEDLQAVLYCCGKDNEVSSLDLQAGFARGSLQEATEKAARERPWVGRCALAVAHLLAQHPVSSENWGEVPPAIPDEPLPTKQGGVTIKRSLQTLAKRVITGSKAATARAYSSEADGFKRKVNILTETAADRLAVKDRLVRETKEISLLALGAPGEVGWEAIRKAVIPVPRDERAREALRRIYQTIATTILERSQTKSDLKRAAEVARAAAGKRESGAPLADNLFTRLVNMVLPAHAAQIEARAKDLKLTAAEEANPTARGVREAGKKRDRLNEFAELGTALLAVDPAWFSSFSAAFRLVCKNAIPEILAECPSVRTPPDPPGIGELAFAYALPTQADAPWNAAEYQRNVSYFRSAGAGLPPIADRLASTYEAWAAAELDVRAPVTRFLGECCPRKKGQGLADLKPLSSILFEPTKQYEVPLLARACQEASHVMAEASQQPWKVDAMGEVLSAMLLLCYVRAQLEQRLVGQTIGMAEDAAKDLLAGLPGVQQAVREVLAETGRLRDEVTAPRGRRVPLRRTQTAPLAPDTALDRAEAAQAVANLETVPPSGPSPAVSSSGEPAAATPQPLAPAAVQDTSQTEDLRAYRCVEGVQAERPSCQRVGNVKPDRRGNVVYRKTSIEEVFPTKKACEVVCTEDHLKSLVASLANKRGSWEIGFEHEAAKLRGKEGRQRARELQEEKAQLALKAKEYEEAARDDFAARWLEAKRREKEEQGLRPAQTAPARQTPQGNVSWAPAPTDLLKLGAHALHRALSWSWGGGS